ncbi:MAG TPA: protein kinase, partial [Vicinamibacterales bacterium]|nr:protein kinase [Vicinamibacterales bacterium]
IEGDGTSTGDPSPANSPTMTLAATQAGVILGTAGYMSPEQARGRAADKRSDVWAFGCLLFEMLAGKRAFEGEDVTDTLAAIVRGEPNWSVLPPTTPPALRALIERCLLKDRSERLPDMSVVRFILSEPASMGAGAHPAATTVASSRRSVGLPAALALVLAAIVITAALAAFWRGSGRVTTSDVSRLTIALPEGDVVSDLRLAPVAIAPDGRTVAYSGYRNGMVQLFVRDLAEPEPRALAGTDGAISPFFKPDGQWIGFFAQGKLKKIAVTGTGLQELADAPFSRGGTWSADDTIYFAPMNISGLRKVSASGGPAVDVTSLDRDRGEISHRWPSITADGQSLLFSVWSGPGADEHWIERLSLGDGTRDVLARNVEGPASVVGGFLITGGRRDSPQALPWHGSAADLDGIAPIDLPFSSYGFLEGTSAYSVSKNGTFAYVHSVRQLARVIWIDRSGRTEPLRMPEGDYVAAALSPDGRRAALHLNSGVQEIWLYDFDTETLTPFVTTGGSSQAPLWSADGKHIFYRATRSGFRNLFRKAVDGSDAEERLMTKPDVVQTPLTVTDDGRWLIYGEAGPEANGESDLWRLSLDGDAEPTRIVSTPAAEGSGRVSPDGRWLAYVSDLSGRPEVWVQPFEGDGPRRQVSREGAATPLWSHDGRELLFISTDGIMSVPVTADSFGTPRLRAAGRFVPSQNMNTNYDIARDGRILHIVPTEEDKPVTRVEIILNGLELLRAPGSGR